MVRVAQPPTRTEQDSPIGSTSTRTSLFEVTDAVNGGLFVWATLPDADATARLVTDAWRAGIRLAGGTLFHSDRRPSRFLRFNAGRSTDPRMFVELRRLLGRHPLG